MKSLEDLKRIREESRHNIKLRESKNGIRVVVGMATCGIAAGARPVLVKFVDEVGKRNLDNITVTQVGCIGECALEPIVEIYDADGKRTTYGKIHEDDVNTIIEEHILKGNVVTSKLLDNLRVKK